MHGYALTIMCASIMHAVPQLHCSGPASFRDPLTIAPSGIASHDPHRHLALALPLGLAFGGSWEGVCIYLALDGGFGPSDSED